MSSEIPVRSLITQRAVKISIVLDGIEVGLEFRHSLSKGTWSMWIFDPLGDLILGPIPVSKGIPDLLGPYHSNTLIPPGRIYIDGPVPNLTTFGFTSKLRYE